MCVWVCFKNVILEVYFIFFKNKGGITEAYWCTKVNFLPQGDYRNMKRIIIIFPTKVNTAAKKSL